MDLTQIRTGKSGRPQKSKTAAHKNSLAQQGRRSYYPKASRVETPDDEEIKEECHDEAIPSLYMDSIDERPVLSGVGTVKREHGNFI